MISAFIIDKMVLKVIDTDGGVKNILDEGAKRGGYAVGQK
jgi:hypothetical protein